MRICPEAEDMMVWKASKNSIFIVNSCCGMLMGAKMGKFPWKMVWNSCIPTKVSFVVWETLWGKVLMLDQLEKEGRHVANRCSHCGKVEENIDQLFLLCKKVQDLGALLFTIFGVNWVLPCSVRDFGRMTRLFYKEKAHEDLVGSSYLPVLDNLEGKKVKKQGCHWRCGAFRLKNKKLSCLHSLVFGKICHRVSSSICYCSHCLVFDRGWYSFSLFPFLAWLFGAFTSFILWILPLYSIIYFLLVLPIQKNVQIKACCNLVLSSHQEGTNN